VSAQRSVVVVGIGSALRGDDGAGIEVVNRLADGCLPAGVRVSAVEGEALELLDQWSGADAAIVVDAVRSGAAAGTVHRFDASSSPLPAHVRRTSTHAVGASDAIELARGLGSLPVTVIVYGIEGADFSAGASLTDEVRGAVVALTEAVRREAAALL
jgi:hydrogenase maturation protease